MAFALYETEPIGLDGELEAVAVHFFCSDKCRAEQGEVPADQTVAYGEDNDFIDGTVCETCGKILC